MPADHEGMVRCALSVLALALVAACNPAGTPPNKVWLESGEGRVAQDAWGLPLAFTPDIQTVSAARLAKECPGLGACTHYDSHVIYLPAGVSAELRAALLLHEIGHTIRPELPHLSEGCQDVDPAVTYSKHVMCAAVSGALTAPTDADLDWALAGWQ